MPDLMRAANNQTLYDKMRNAMIPLIQKYSVSIAAYYDGKLQQHATGSLVQFADHYFLVTAAHALHDFHKGRERLLDLDLFIDNGHANDLVKLEGRYFATEIVRDRQKSKMRLGGERDDVWDIGLWELSDRTVDKLTQKSFLNRHMIQIDSDLTTGIYFLAGCPCEWSQTDYSTNSFSWKWLTYIAHPYSKPKNLQNFDGRFHIALQLGDDPWLPKELNGISGSAIWKLADYPVRNDWNIDQARAVAIQTCVLTSIPRAIRGTKWACVLPVLAKMHPKIQEIFKLWLPGGE